MSHGTNRRDFMRNAALAGVGALALGRAAFGDEPKPDEKEKKDAAKEPSGDKLNIACIGVGGKGGGDSDHAGKFGNVVAICDINDHTLAEKAQHFPKAK